MFGNLLRITVALMLTSGASVAMATPVTMKLTGEFSSYWPGPFVGGDDFEISMDWESGDSRTWGTYTSSFFDDSLNDVSIKVNGQNVTTGSGGRIIQRNNSGIYDIFEVRFGLDYGSVVNTVAPANGFEELFIRFITPTDGLFKTPGEEYFLINGSYPMNVESVDMSFDGPDAIRMIVDNYTVQGVPAPSGAALLMLGLLLAGFRASRRGAEL